MFNAYALHSLMRNYCQLDVGQVNKWLKVVISCLFAHCLGKGCRSQFNGLVSFQSNFKQNNALSFSFYIYIYFFCFGFLSLSTVNFF